MGDPVAKMKPFNFAVHASQRHPPYFEGELQLSFQRPPEECRTYKSSGVEDLVTDMKARMKDKDLARMFENCFPNSLDTTVSWVSDDHDNPKSFIIAGDMDAAWLRDNLWQIQPYQRLLKSDKAIKHLWLGLINAQIEYLCQAPYANSFQPPPESGRVPVLDHVVDMSKDIVHPQFDRSVAFEAKYALDSLASFLRLSRVYYENTGADSFANKDWIATLRIILEVLKEQSLSTFDEAGKLRDPAYSFQRASSASMAGPYGGPESPPNAGSGNPVSEGTGLIKSSFRASDDATIFPFWIPGNAFVAAELIRVADYVKDKNLAEETTALGSRISAGIYEHAVFVHPIFGQVFAYEVDGYGSRLVMDDASPPSLLSLPYLGFLDSSDPIYQNTRRMVLSRQGNPYFLEGTRLRGQGSPHINLRTVWPIGIIAQIFTSESDEEILEQLEALKTSTADLGLIHEGIDVDDPSRFLRTWYAWGNSAFGEMILDLADRKPHLLF